MTTSTRLLLLALTASAAQAAVIYELRDAHFFGGTPGPTREITSSGIFNPAGQNLPYTFSTGGPAPNVYSGTAASSGGPLLLSAATTVNAASTSALTSNLPPFDPLPLVALTSSRITETGMLITGGVGTGYFLPTFRIFGTFNDAHSQAFASATVCAGIASCVLSGAGNSTGGVQNINTTFTPGIGASTLFTFGNSFNTFFFLTASVTSQAGNNLNPGQIAADLNMEILGYSIVDAGGNAIAGAQLTSELFNPQNPVPEPGSFALVAIGGAAALLARRRSAGR